METKNRVGNKIKYLKLHSTVFIPGVGNLGDALPSPTKTVENLSMIHSENGVELVAGRLKVSAIIPWPNVQLAVYE